MEAQQVLQFLRRRGWRVLGWAIAFAVVAGAASHYLRTPVYEARAQVLLQQNASSQAVNQQQPANQSDAATFAASQVVVIRSAAVARAAAKAIPGHPSAASISSRLRVVVDPSNTLLTIVASSQDAAQARATANAVARAYIANRYTYAIGNLSAAANGMTSQLDSLQSQIGTLDTQISAATAFNPSGVGALQARRDAVLSQYQTLYAQQEELKVAVRLTRSQAELVSKAGLPGSPVTPKPLRDALLVGFAGLLFGLGIELLREKLDDKIDTADELERVTAQPVLAELPVDAAVARSVSPAMVRPGEFSEGIRTLRTSLQFLGVDRPLRRIVVSSPGEGDGKTTVAANLAVAYAEAGFRTVLVSGDLRRPRVDTLFGKTRTGVGLSALLATPHLRPQRAAEPNGNGNGKVSGVVRAAGDGTRAEQVARMQEFLHQQTVPIGIENLTMLPSGATPPNPAELLGSTRMREVLDALGATADMIVIDTPPALLVADSVVLAEMCDGVLIVAAARKTTQRDLKLLVARYRAAGVQVLGSVLNRAPRSRAKSSYYDGYYTAPGRKPKSQVVRQ